jgi:hypothetical protein
LRTKAFFVVLILVFVTLLVVGIGIGDIGDIFSKGRFL